MTFLLKYPTIMESNINDLDLKVDYLCETLGGHTDLLKQTPIYLVFNFNQHIRLRSEFMQAMGYSPLQFGLDFLLLSNSQEFSKHLNSNTELFDKFKKAYFEREITEETSQQNFQLSSSSSSSLSPSTSNMRKTGRNNPMRRQIDKDGYHYLGNNNNNNNKIFSEEDAGTVEKCKTSLKSLSATTATADYNSDDDKDREDQKSILSGSSNRGKSTNASPSSLVDSRESLTDPSIVSQSSSATTTTVTSNNQGIPFNTNNKTTKTKYEIIKQDSFITLYDESNVAECSDSFDILFELSEMDNFF